MPWLSPVPTEGLPELISLACLLDHVGHIGSNPVFLGGGPSEDRLGADSHSAGPARKVSGHSPVTQAGQQALAQETWG